MRPLVPGWAEKEGGESRVSRTALSKVMPVSFNQPGC